MNNIPFPSAETTFFLTGNAGNIELLTTNPINSTTNAVAIICHPHSLQGGTMNNKVVYMLAKTLHDFGLNTVRFNFRGVGKSDGEYDGGIAETDDVLTIIEWIENVCPAAPIWLAGFSFGSYVAARAANQYPAQYLISIAPPVTHYDFTPLTNIQCPWLVIQGNQDEVIEPQAVFNWAAQHKPKPQLVVLPDTSHFFHGKLLDLRRELEEAIKILLVSLVQRA